MKEKNINVGIYMIKNWKVIEEVKKIKGGEVKEIKEKMSKKLLIMW